MIVGILAVQGAFAAHQKKIQYLGVKSILVKNKADLGKVDALILPGGESTSMKYLLHKHGLWDVLRDKLSTIPVLATCAGVILLKDLGILGVDILRNAYGSQVASNLVPLSIDDGKKQTNIDGFFIRAPLIRSISDPNIRVLAYLNKDPVLLEKDLIIAATFHPELSKSDLIHEMFVNKISELV